ncbi:MAG: hypothetical protein WCA82_13625 [Jiangellales bacterium]
MSSDRPDETAWNEIVASLQSSDEAEVTWPAAEDVDDTPPEPEPAGAPPDDEPVIVWRGSEADIDAEIERAVPDEHFVPPEPPPLPRADLITWAAWSGAIGAPILLLVMTALGLSSGLLAAGAVVAFVGGIAVLITRMSSQRDPLDPDDGAVV